MKTQSVPTSDSDRLITFDGRPGELNTDGIVSALRSDQVALIRNAAEQDADLILGQLSLRVGLLSSLEMQAAFASVHGHRNNVSQYFMTVNRRQDYDVILPHSEGSHFMNIQLASFYCHENTTDGGESLLLQVNQASECWASLKELVTRIAPGGRALSPSERALVKVRCQADPVHDLLKPQDVVLEEQKAPLPGLKCFWVLAGLRKRRSVVLERDVYTYWDSVCTTDEDAVDQSVSVLSRLNLLKEPAGGPPVSESMRARSRKVWKSGVNYESLFTAMIVHKLRPGDLIIFNNLTWAHAAGNWTPNSGTRKVVAAFA
jgi:hypothetical protein